MPIKKFFIFILTFSFTAFPSESVKINCTSGRIQKAQSNLEKIDNDPFEYYVGEPYPDFYDNLKKYDVAKEAKVHKLGEGEWGRVYRVEEPAGNYVLKVFKDGEMQTIDEELARYELWKELEDKNNSLFKVADVKKGKGHALILSDTRGQDLSKILSSTKVPQEIKQKLILKFNEIKEKSVSKLKQKYNVHNIKIDEDMKAHGGVIPVLLEVEDKNGVGRVIAIKPANFIVDPNNLEMTLIDPL